MVPEPIKISRIKAGLWPALHAQFVQPWVVCMVRYRVAGCAILESAFFASALLAAMLGVGLVRWVVVSRVLGVPQCLQIQRGVVLMGFSMRRSGNVAKWAPLKPLVGMSQQSPGFFPPACKKSLERRSS